MSFDKKIISIAEANAIIATEEGYFADLKSIEILPSKLSKTISAFANSSGGEVFLGVAETKQANNKKTRKWSGFHEMEAANAHLQVIEDMGVLGNHYKPVFLSCKGKTGYVLHLTIFKTKDILKATDGVPYVRVNASNDAVDTEEGIRRLRLNKGIVTFEDEPVNIPLRYVAHSKVAQEFMKNVVPSAEPEEWLDSQFLLHDGKPVAAAVLLFADQPQAALPKRSAVKIFRYKTREEEGARDTLAGDPMTIEGCLYDLIDRSVATTKKMIDGLKRLGVHGMEDVTYPDETLHEIVTNAVLHRDYSVAADIQIRIYDNRIEVESPGRLPGYVTIKNILNAQTARNPKIVRMINKFPDPPNKDVGEGLNTAFEAMKKLRLKEPEIEESDHSVTVYIGHAPLASPEDTVLSYLETHEQITNMIARQLTGIRSENSMKNVFLRLKKSKLLEQVPGKRGPVSAWRYATGIKDTGGQETTPVFPGLEVEPKARNQGRLLTIKRKKEPNSRSKKKS